MIEITTSLFEHIRNRLPDEYDLGDNNTQYDESGIPNHRVWEQSLREDHQGDVGVFKIRETNIDIFHGVMGYQAIIQIAVVCFNGDIEDAEKYLRSAFNNIKSNDKSTSIYVKKCNLISLTPLGKNSVGNQMVSIELSLLYVPLQ